MTFFHEPCLEVMFFYNSESKFFSVILKQISLNNVCVKVSECH